MKPFPLATLSVVLSVPLVRLDEDLPLPAYAKPGDAGLDLYSRDSVTVRKSGGRALVPTGVRVGIPEGHAGFVLPRSGLALRRGVSLLNTPGLIDSGYRGELIVIVINTDPDSDFVVSRGDRIAQLVVQRIEQVAWEEVDELSESARGAGGFGHSGR